MAKLTQASRPIRLHVPSLGDDAVYLLSIDGEEKTSGLFAFKLEFLAEASKPVEFASILGQGATVELLHAAATRYFNGIIHEITELERDRSLIRYRAALVPQLWYWVYRVRSRIFQWSSVPNILIQVLDGLPLQNGLAGDYPLRSVCVQYQESDFAFASRLMEEEGIAYHFDHSADRHVLVLSDSRSTNRSIAGPPSIAYRPRPRQNDGCVTRWHRTQRVICPSHIVRDWSFLLADKQLEHTQNIGEEVEVGTATYRLGAGAIPGLETCHYPSFAKSFDGVGTNGEDRSSDLAKIWSERTRVAKLRVQEAATEAFTLTGSATVPQFCPGFTFTLHDHECDDGEYLLTRVVHQARAPAPDSGEEPDLLTYQNEFECLPAALPFRPRRRTPRPVIPGVQTATVVTHRGESSLDGLGRVKVKFHWDRSSTTDLNASCWVRVAQVWAGKKWGGMFFPRKGHEVVVAFVDGDPDCPLVVGSVYNSVNVPPYDLPDNFSIGGIKSCIVDGDPDKNFNGIFFHDNKDEAYTHIHSEHSDIQHSEENRFSHVPHRTFEISGGFPT